MADTESDTILRRMASVGRRQHEAPGMPPIKALRLALARAAEQAFGLALQVQGIRQEDLDCDALMEGLSEDMLTLVLESATGDVGVMALTQPALAAVIEQQTLGQVLNKPAKERPPTRTDAAMVAPMVDSALNELASNLTDDPAAWWARGHRYSDMSADLRALALQLRAPSYKVFRVNAEFHGGSRRGTLVLALPLPPQDEAKTMVPEPAIGETYETQMQCVPAELRAVLGKISISLERAQTLKVGDLLELSPDAFRRAFICGQDGRKLAAGVLGQSNGAYAMRLHAAPGLARAVAEAVEVAQDEERRSAGGQETAVKPASEPVRTAMPNPVVPDANLPSAAEVDDLSALPDLPSLKFDDEEGGEDLGLALSPPRQSA